MVAGVGSTQLITVGNDDIPLATLLSILWEGTVTAHMVRANLHRRQIRHRASALLVVAGWEAYISPSRYASKAEQGEVVPTWNHSTVHLTGRAQIHEDGE